MTDITRRNLFKAVAASAVAVPLVRATRADATETCVPADPHWGHGIEDQRKADLGNGRYLNPIVAGDHPDPTVLKDGDDYYMTFTPFTASPGIVIWHSTDLLNWSPVATALHKPMGNVFAVNLCKYKDRYYIYLPAQRPGGDWAIFVIWARQVTGPWSDPIDTGVTGCIDPAHVVGEDGKRYLFVNGIRMVRLTDDGLAADGPLKHAYTPWHYPSDWVVEDFAPEGPKLLRRDGWFYLVSAVGGTAGPPTSHMVIVARSRSVHGPWENCPHNPIVHTRSAAEPWWSRGHATFIDGPAGDWWMIYHGYENSFRTLGRQALLEPMEWTADGWPVATGGDLSRPLPIPAGGKPGPAGFALSDDFSSNRFGIQWAFHDPRPDEIQRARYGGNGLQLAGAGHSPADSSPMVCRVGDRAYVAEIGFELSGDAEAGLLLFYNHKAFVGVGFTPDTIKTFEYAQELPWARIKRDNRRVRVRMTNDHNVVTFEYSHDDGHSWQLHTIRMEVSGINHNVFGDFLSLRVGLYSTGATPARLHDFRYRAIKGNPLI
ncbi:family 43 glycosylhydrolase [Dyella sp. A6]|uniref:family 43 glycosylhydrolase n=1 Tax=Dyella aluminiiresistens TaxID=3069105 RepID=UPI002E789B9F|nr:family 43 glycosylhydrolase [Dyella sp. A6]